MGDRCGCCHYIPAEAPAEAPRRLTSFTEAGECLQALTFSPDGRWLAGLGWGCVHVWDVAGGVYHSAVRPGHVEIHAVTFSPDSRLLAVAGSDRMLRFVHVDTGQEIAAYPTPIDVRYVVIAPDNLTLAISAVESLEVWGRANASLPWLLIDNQPIEAWSIAFNLSGTRLVAGGVGELVMWKIPDAGQQPVHLGKTLLQTALLMDLTFSQDGERVVVLEVEAGARPGRAGRRNVCCWEVNNYRYTKRALVRVANYGRFSPEGSWVASALGKVIILASILDEGQWYRLESAPGPDVTALAFSPDGQTLATADEDGRVKLWPWRRLIEA